MLYYIWGLGNYSFTTPDQISEPSSTNRSFSCNMLCCRGGNKFLTSENKYRKPPLESLLQKQSRDRITCQAAKNEQYQKTASFFLFFLNTSWKSLIASKRVSVRGQQASNTNMALSLCFNGSISHFLKKRIQRWGFSSLWEKNSILGKFSQQD